MQNTPPQGIIEALKNPILYRQSEILAAKPGLKTNFPSLRKWHLHIQHSSNKFRLSYHPLLYVRLVFLSIAKLFLSEYLELFLNLLFHLHYSYQQSKQLIREKKKHFQW